MLFDVASLRQKAQQNSKNKREFTHVERVKSHGSKLHFFAATKMKDQRERDFCENDVTHTFPLPFSQKESHSNMGQ